ncbi:MAG TPA: hypothetical protein VK399_04160, partial [Longimicrobiaceae bacterium]|nr:hypothetical protein [Longimicrobiaceae bacterium]
MISLQLRTDADFDLRRSAWKRVAAALGMELSKFLGCEPGLVLIAFDSPSRDDAEPAREMKITVHLANGFRVDVPVKTCLRVVTIHPRRTTYWSDRDAPAYGRPEVLIAY